MRLLISFSNSFRVREFPLPRQRTIWPVIYAKLVIIRLNTLHNFHPEIRYFYSRTINAVTPRSRYRISREQVLCAPRKCFWKFDAISRISSTWSCEVNSQFSYVPCYRISRRALRFERKLDDKSEAFWLGFHVSFASFR